MEYRAEKKYLVTDRQLAVLSARLKCAIPSDKHQKGNCYVIRSLYFDDYWDSCMQENAGGVDQRRKFRIRLYNANPDRLSLEIKEKKSNYTKKLSCLISREECEHILQHDLPLRVDERVPLNLLQVAAHSAMMQPKVVIEYERTAFVYPAGNVRITFDRNISASARCRDFLAPEVPCRVALLPPGIHILEVKFDEFLPDFIAQLIEDGMRNQTAFSKYYLGRLALEGDLSERMLTV